jgi:prophage tail gpP-like protein
VPNPDEVATLIVAGRRFDNFKSVWVQERWTEAFPQFRFSTADVIETPPTWQLLQFKPGDECAIYLGGRLAISGFILSRQTAYDANNHGVQLSGVGRSWAAARASILDKTGSFDGMSFEAAARKVIAPTGVGIEVVGMLDPTPFKKLQCEPGETVWNFCERIARPRGIVLGSNHRGEFVFIGDHVYAVSENLIEGFNILRCNAIISIENTRSDFRVRGHTPATDGHSGTTASEMEASAPGSLRYYSPLLTPAEQPVWSVAELAVRAHNESVWAEGTIITATIVVQGWLRGGRDLWRAGEKVYVNSPMAMLDMQLKIQTVTFTQDRESGTLTTLDLVAPWLLKDRDFKVGGGIPPSPDPGKPSPDPATTPPATPPPDPPPDRLPPAIPTE